MSDYLRMLNLFSLMLLVLGGVNLGFTAIVGTDPLIPILGGYSAVLTRVIYGAFGLSALWVFYAYLMTPGQDLEKDK
jgi:uncharacterized membrane protein YuzA (DUF378 family)